MVTGDAMRLVAPSRSRGVGDGGLWHVACAESFQHVGLGRLLSILHYTNHDLQLLFEKDLESVRALIR
jgi:hypothetical protein